MVWVCAHHLPGFAGATALTPVESVVEATRAVCPSVSSCEPTAATSAPSASPEPRHLLVAFGSKPIQPKRPLSICGFDPPITVIATAQVV